MKEYTFSCHGGKLYISPQLDKSDLTPELALRLSVEKWKFISENEKVKHGGNINTCALCCLFWSDDCCDCPIRQASQHKWCDHTPFYLFDETGDHCYAKDEYEFLLVLQEQGIEAGREWLEKWRNDQA